ncbi:MAG: cell division protein [Alphaproteobacteria bacterium]|nr:cell division protein [Alphaproteobacteria bacterium]
MIRRRVPVELPFSGDPSTRFLPGVIALMVFLTALALAGTMLLERAVADWRQSLTTRVTVEVPPGPKLDERLAAAEAMLRATPGLLQVRLLTEDEVAELLRPWLGDAAQRLDLPLPRLIDATLVAGGGLDLAGLRRRLEAASPGAAIDDHRDWLSGLVVLARGLEWLSVAVIVLVGASAMAAIVFVVRSGLAIHRGVVEFLHLIGAQDGYIGRQFERQILRLGLRGAGLGLAGVVIVAAPVAFLAQALEGPGVRAPGLEAWHLAVIGLVPLAAVLAAGVTARLTVRRALARLP